MLSDVNRSAWYQSPEFRMCHCCYCVWKWLLATFNIEYWLGWAESLQSAKLMNHQKAQAVNLYQERWHPIPNSVFFFVVVFFAHILLICFQTKVCQMLNPLASRPTVRFSFWTQLCLSARCLFYSVARKQPASAWPWFPGRTQSLQQNSGLQIIAFIYGRKRGRNRVRMMVPLKKCSVRRCVFLS